MCGPGRNVGVTGNRERGTGKMKWNKKFEYPASIRSSIEGKRHYEITGQKLPSVTTILSATQSSEKKKN